MKLNIIVGNDVFAATMYENKSVADFASLLPITLLLGDYNKEERSSRLPKRLLVDEVEGGMTVTSGDISYYTPFRNLCISYQDTGLSFCQVPLGKIENRAIEAIRSLSGSEPIEVTFELAEDEKYHPRLASQ